MPLTEEKVVDKDQSNLQARVIRKIFFNHTYKYYMHTYTHPYLNMFIHSRDLIDMEKSFTHLRKKYMLAH